MALSVSAVVLLAFLIVFLSRKDGLKFFHALVCTLFGFGLAGTALAPSIAHSSHAFALLLGNLRF